LLKNFDEHEISKTYKFGIIYMKKGQITEEELFSNPNHSESFEEFLNFIGKRIKLKDFKGFKGGLDTSFGQTGDESVFEMYDDKEIMFHVSTLLPYNKNDSQQLERKRHIGNDIVTIIFQDDNTPFAPDMIASNFLHSFIVIQKVPQDDSVDEPTRYRVAVTSRHDVPNYSPEIPENGIFEKSDLFKEWLLLKLINAELACCKASKFRTLKTRTRNVLVDELYQKLHEYSETCLKELNQNNEYGLFESQKQQQLQSDSLSRKLSLNDSHLDTSTQSKSKLTQKSNGALNFFQTVKKHFTKNSSKSDAQRQMIKAKENFSSSTFTLPHNALHLPTNELLDTQIQNRNHLHQQRLRIRSSTVETPPASSRDFTASLKDRSYEPKDLAEVKQKRLTLNGSVSNLKMFKNSKITMNSSELNLHQIGNFNSSTFDSTYQPSSSPTDDTSSNSSSKKSIANSDESNGFQVTPTKKPLLNVSNSPIDNGNRMDECDTGLVNKNYFLIIENTDYRVLFFFFREARRLIVAEYHHLLAL
jgi:hypothetical protein